MFTFFGLFADPLPDLSERIAAIWPDLNVINVEQPISAIGARFSGDHYVPANEDLPDAVVRRVEALSAACPTVRFLLLRTECWGGICANWGLIIRNGQRVLHAEQKGALRRLIGYWGVDIGAREIFDPLRRDYPWDRCPSPAVKPSDR
jgi:hypothetical protein